MYSAGFGEAVFLRPMQKQDIEGRENSLLLSEVHVSTFQSPILSPCLEARDAPDKD